MSVAETPDPQVLKAFIESTGVSYRQNGSSYIFTCPRCEKKEKLYIRKRDGRFVCWHCKDINGFQGRPEYALYELTGVSVPVIKDALYGAQVSSGIELDVDWGSFFDEDQDRDEEVLPLFHLEWPFNYYPLDHKFGRRGIEYLESRGIPEQVAIQYQIRYSPHERAVVFPAIVGNFLLGWQLRMTYETRWMDEETGEMREVPKAITLKGFQKEFVWMFQNRLAGSQHAVLCEGPIDALKAHLCGGNVCSMGKGVSGQQIQIIRNMGIKRVYLGLDPDAAEETTKLIREFSDLDVYRIEVPEGKKDLGQMSLEEVKDAFLSAQRVTTNHLVVHLT